jgi:hypothetical protein
MTSNPLGAALVTAGLMTASAAGAVTVSASSAGAFLSLAWSVTSHYPSPVVATGVDRVFSYVVATDEDGASSDGDAATLTLSNTLAEPVSVDIDASFAASAGTFVGEGGLPGRVRFDSQAYGLLVGPGIDGQTLASSSGTYACTEPDPDAPDFDCVGVSETYIVYDFQFAPIVLAPGESVAYDLYTSAFAKLDVTPAAVPLPAGGATLAGALVGLALLGRRRG